jgi:diaminopropionate ammonia-lyase
VVTAARPGSWYGRPAARQWRCAPPVADASAFHAGLPGYRPTELRELPALAGELRVGRVFVKDESERLGLPAFKVLGASWAVARIMAGPAGPASAAAAPADAGPRPAAGAATGDLSVATLRRTATARPVELVTATDGNHGRAVAWMSRLLGLRARVFVPRAVPAGARAGIAGEGAAVTVVDGSYDRAVERAAAYAVAGPARVLVQDSAWPGYEQVPAWIVEGYGTLLREVDAQLAERGLPGPGLVSAPVGVGSLAQAVVAHYRSRPRESGSPGPAVLAVEPESAACLLASLQAGAPRSVPTPGTVMAGLDCGTVSGLAWPVLAAGLDAAIAVPDRAATRAAADLARRGVSSGPSGAASLAGARAALTGPGAQRRRDDLAVTASSVLVLLSTEGSAAAG